MPFGNSGWGHLAKSDFKLPSMCSQMVITAMLSQEPNVLIDETLEVIGPSLVNLEHFCSTACPKITHHGVWAMISSSRDGILRLTMEDLHYNFVS